MAGELLGLEARIDRPDGGPPRLDVRFEVPPGITLLVGPSGAGKTTCLSVIAGLLRPKRCRLSLGSTDLARLPPHRRKVALVFQALALFPHYTALQNVEYGMPPSRDRAALAHRWLERMKVDHLARRSPGTLSGGEAQRVAIARALASAPRVLLLDEPFSALDEELRAQLIEEVRRWVGELALPAILVTHQPAKTEGPLVVLEQGCNRRR